MDDTAHERNLPYSAAIAAAHGLPRDAALNAITLAPAQILGIDDQYGSLETGKSATLIITTGDPLEVTTQIQSAFIDGREIDLSNKQTKLYEKYRDRYQQMGVIEKEPAK
jgi:imidazolonepropionase-like amidohydrolase